jgi:CheY-like chemotaxis protein
MNSVKKARPRILVADDSPENQELMSALLGRFDLDFVATHDGGETLAALQSGGFDLVLLDFQMPVLDGFAVASKFRASESSPSLIIVGLSAYEPNEARQRAIASGMNDFLSKPVTLSALSHVLERWLDCPARTGSARPMSEEKIEPMPGRLVVNPASIELLRSLKLEGESLLGRQVRGFLASAPISLVAIRKAAAAEDRKQYAEEAHRLKTLCGIVGAERMSDLCDKMQKSGASELRADELRQYAETLASEIDLVSAELRKQVESKGT